MKNMNEENKIKKMDTIPATQINESEVELTDNHLDDVNGSGVIINKIKRATYEAKLGLNKKRNQEKH